MWSCPRLCQEILIRCQPGLPSCEGLTGAGGYASKVAQPHGCHNGSGPWWESSVFIHVYSSAGLLKCPHGMAMTFPK